MRSREKIAVLLIAHTGRSVLTAATKRGAVLLTVIKNGRSVNSSDYERYQQTEGALAVSDDSFNKRFLFLRPRGQYYDTPREKFLYWRCDRLTELAVLVRV